MTLLRIAEYKARFMGKKTRQRQNWCSKGFICNRTFLQDNKNMQYLPFTALLYVKIQKILTVIIPVFSIWPFLLIHIRHYSGIKASWEESFGIPGCVYVLGCRIHCIQEGHLVLWTMVKKLFS